MKTMEIKVHSIQEDGLPDMDALSGKVAFIYDGNIVSGWPLYPYNSDKQSDWEADDDIAVVSVFRGVTHWVEFPVEVWALEGPDDEE